MPVPFPDDVNVVVVPPDAAEARTIAGGVANAVAADGELTGLQRLLLEALIESMTTFVVPVRNVPRLGPAEFARALARRSEPFRQRMLQLMLVCALVLVPLPDEVVKRIEEYASELGVTNDMLPRRGAICARQPWCRVDRFPTFRLHAGMGSLARGGAAHLPCIERCVGAMRARS